MKQTENYARSLTTTALFTAVLAGLSIIQVPMPSGVPLTLQTFGVALCGYVLGRRYAFFSTALYLLVGAVGLPVFSGMRGGPGVLLGPTGGFLFGFLILAAMAGWGKDMGKKWSYWGMGLFGLFFCHLIGSGQFSVVAGRTLMQSIWMVSLPYLLKDILSVVGAGVAGVIICRRLAAAGLLTTKKSV